MAFVGMEWIVVIIAVILFLFGAKRIPELARSLGRARGEIDRGRRLVEMEMLKAEREVRTDPVTRRTSESGGPSVARSDDAIGASPIQRAATEFGITTEGRTDQELKELIRKRVTGE